jgi:hypothetical protein
MKLPRLTCIYTVNIYLKGGTIVQRDFRNFKITYNVDVITSLKWTTDDSSMFYVSLCDISCAQIVRSRYRFRFRH